MTDTHTPIEKLDGKCLCGAVGVALSAAKPLVDVCHCTMCRQWGGGAFMGMSGESFAITGEEHVTIYPSSDWAERAFCAKCGSNLWYRFTPSDHYSFSAGVFDVSGEGGSTIEIEQQIFVDEKPAYYDFAQQTPMKTGAEIIAEAEAAGHVFAQD